MSHIVLLISILPYKYLYILITYNLEVDITINLQIANLKLVLSTKLASLVRFLFGESKIFRVYAFMGNYIYAIANTLFYMGG